MAWHIPAYVSLFDVGDVEPGMATTEDSAVSGDGLEVELLDGVRAAQRACPETLTEVAGRLGVPVRPHGYRF